MLLFNYLDNNLIIFILINKLLITENDTFTLNNLITYILTNSLTNLNSNIILYYTK